MGIVLKCIKRVHRIVPLLATGFPSHIRFHFAAIGTGTFDAASTPVAARAHFGVFDRDVKRRFGLKLIKVLARHVENLHSPRLRNAVGCADFAADPGAHGCDNEHDDGKKL